VLSGGREHDQGGRGAGSNGRAVPPSRRRPATDRGATGRPAAPGRRPVRRPARPPRPPRLADPWLRLRLGTLLALALFSVIGLRLVELQVTDASAYAAEGLRDRLRERVLPAPRGSILDRNGAVLAHSIDARYVYSDPSRVEEPVRTAEALLPLLGMSRSELLPRLVEHKRPDGRPSEFEWLARGVDVDTANAIMALGLPGIGVGRDERREVPGHDLAANVIGFTGADLSGLEGLEARYDNVLRGVNGDLKYEAGQGALAKEIPGGYRKETPAQPGSSLQLTIDRDLQYEVQRVLGVQMPKVGATFGCAVVLDVRTGEVLAQASYPAYDAADPLKAKPTEREDAATAVVVDPGSVHKAVTIGAALQEGIITPTSAITVAPTVRKGDTTYRDTHPFAAGTRLTLPAVLAYSSNVATIKIAERLGAEKLYEYQRKFGLGQATGVGVPGEADGLIQPPQNWSGSSYGSIPIGLGVAVTPLQIAAAYAAIANDGRWVQPHLVRETIGPDGKVTPAPQPQSRQVLSPANAAALRTMLEAVVTAEGATGRLAAIPGYRVAGKTGTGQRVVNGRYVAGEVASFVGMAPADAPRYVIAVFAHTSGGNGGAVAAPAFHDMMEFALRHYRVPPTGTKPPKFSVYP
jgi:cell division protein FtsI (penicillin-binding protein 3)